MKHSIFYSAVMATTAICIAACSPTNTDVAGIGGSGITSTGTITGFGSIFVNDIEFFTSSSTFNVDDNPDLTEDDLAIGMRVTVKGTLNADGVTGTATSVTYDDTLQGPVSNVTDIDADNKTITVLGIEVALSSTTTKFDTSGSASGNFNFNNIQVNDNVEISGVFNSNGVLIATRVELKEHSFTIDSIVEMRGTISGLTGTDFILNLQGIIGVTVNVDAKSAALEDLPGLSNGAFVEVKGTCEDLTCTTIIATRIQGESDGYDNGDGENEVEIDGFITRYADDSDFDVNGLPVNASEAEFEPSSLVLAESLRVEVEGTVVNDILMATKVKLEDD